MAKKLYGVVITSSPGWRSIAISATSKASVPEVTPIPNLRLRIRGHFPLQRLDLWAADENLRVGHAIYRRPDLLADWRILRFQVE